MPNANNALIVKLTIDSRATVISSVLSERPTQSLLLNGDLLVIDSSQVEPANRKNHFEILLKQSTADEPNNLFDVL